MTSSSERVAHFVDDLLKGRRPSRFPVEREDAGALGAAAALAAAAPDSDLPSAHFAERLHHQLAQAIEHPREPSASRRRFLGRLGLPAAAAFLGAAAATGVRYATDQLGPDLSPDDSELVPRGVAAAWMPAAPFASLRPGEPLRFTAGAVQGFLILDSASADAGDASIRAISAICTHMGCLLNPNVDAGRLDCPCHGASFSLEGDPLSPEYTRPLPRLRARVNGDIVEVFAA